MLGVGKLRWTVTLVLLLAPAAPTGAAEPEFSFTHVAVRQGDGAVYQGPCGELGIIDANRFRAAEMLADLDRRGSRALRWAVATHYDADHIGALVDIFTAPGASVGTVYDRGGDRNAHDTQTYRGYYDYVTSPATARVRVRIGDTFSLCSGDLEVQFTVVSVADDANRVAGGQTVSEENDKGVCLLVAFHAFRHATCGDVNGTSEGARADVESAVAPAIGQVHVAKVNHHGARFSSNQTYVNTLSPSVAVISVGANGFGHPDPGAITRWQNAGARVLRTHKGGPAGEGGNDLIDGNISITTTGFNSYRVTTQTGGDWTFPLPAGPSGPSVKVTRLSGPNRFATAVAVSASLWPPGTAIAVVATGTDFPDALAAGAVAARHGAPLLLDGSGLLDELTRLQVSGVIVAGGPAAVPESTVQQIRDLPSRPEVRRVSGPDRFATAGALATEAGAPSGHVGVASGLNFPDAVAAGALLATASRPPVLLSLRERLPQSTTDTLAPLNANTARLLGGSAVLSDQVRAQLEQHGLQVTRSAGAGRYDTSVELLRQALAELPAQPRPLVVATGANFPDALAAGAAVARLGGTLLLVPTEGLTATQQRFLSDNRHRFDQAVIIGGTAAVSTAAEQQLRSTLG